MFLLDPFTQVSMVPACTMLPKALSLIWFRYNQTAATHVFIGLISVSPTCPWIPWGQRSCLSCSHCIPNSLASGLVHSRCPRNIVSIHGENVTWVLTWMKTCLGRILCFARWLVSQATHFERISQTSLVAQWTRTCPPMQWPWGWSLIWEDSTCFRATKPMCHNCWACMPQVLKPVHLEPVLHKRIHCNEKPEHCN